MLAIIAGTKKHFPNKTFTLGKADYTTAQLVTVFQALADAMAAVEKAHASVKDALTALKEEQAKARSVLRLYTNMLHSMFGSSAQDLSDFALEPRKEPKAKTGEEIVAASAKRRSTRTARGTKGSVQKLSIKGDVTGVLVMPVTHAGDASPHSPSASHDAEAASNGAAANGSASK